MWWGFIKNSVLFILLTTISCKTSTESGPIIYLASSLLPFRHTIVEEVPGVELIFMTSSAIAKHIEQKAPCEIAILADEKWRDYLLEKNLITAQTNALMKNSLVLASLHAHHEDAVTLLNNLPPDEKLIIADPNYVPLGEYTKEALIALRLYEKWKSRFIPASSAHQAVIMLKQKAARYAVLYKTDAFYGQLNVVFEFSKITHRPIRYPLVSCKTARNQKLDQVMRIFLSKQFKEKVKSLGF